MNPPLHRHIVIPSIARLVTRRTEFTNAERRVVVATYLTRNPGIGKSPQNADAVRDVIRFTIGSENDAN